MGIYLNPGNENFREMLNGRIYVDKSMMISEINRFMDGGNKYICVSHPRRFGKTMASEMLSAYYSKGCDSDELFNGLKIHDDPGYATKLGKYNVIKIDLNSEYEVMAEGGDLVDEITGFIRDEMKEEFCDVKLSDKDSLARCILKVYGATGQTFVIIIDEYDVLVREQVDDKLLKKYLKFLNGLFKSATLRPAISLAYLTGILPVVRDKIQSKLNVFEEYTILNSYELSEYMGFTDEEVRALCSEHDMDYDECKSWYDGYSVNGLEIYNPESVVKSMIKKEYGNYWSKTSTYEAISDRIRMNFSGTKETIIKMLSGEEVDVNITGYMNTMTSFHSRNDLFAYLMYIGYLAYNKDEKTCRIPNREVRQEWFNAVETEVGYETTNAIIESSKQLLKSTIAGDSDEVAKALDISHIHVTSNRSYNNEDALQSAIYLAFIYALNDYTCIREVTAGKGFADVVYIPIHPDVKCPAMIIELKRNDSEASALKQIREKRYFDCLKHYQGDLLFVGINYDEKDKTHTCGIERFVKEDT